MSTYLFKFLMAIACFLYLVMAGAFLGEAHDYQTIGYGLIPMISVPLALIMAGLAFFSYRLMNAPAMDEEEGYLDDTLALTHNLTKE